MIDHAEFRKRLYERLDKPPTDPTDIFRESGVRAMVNAYLRYGNIEVAADVTGFPIRRIYNLIKMLRRQMQKDT